MYFIKLTSRDVFWSDIQTDNIGHIEMSKNINSDTDADTG